MMELTRDAIEKLSGDDIIPEVASLAKQLLREMDKPKVWANAPNDATFASVHYAIELGKPYPGTCERKTVYFYYREPPKSRIDEIAEECVKAVFEDKAPTVDVFKKAIKSAILKDREERDSETLKAH